jgi:hypothetical protein
MTGAEMLFLATWGLLVQNSAHQATHVLSAKLAGSKVLSYKPYPGFHRDNTFSMDDIMVEGADNTRNAKIYAIGPHVLNTGVFTASFLIQRNIETKKTRRYVMLAGMISPLIDSTVNYLVGFIPRYQISNDFRYCDIKVKIGIGILLSAAWYIAINEWQSTSH